MVGVAAGVAGAAWLAGWIGTDGGTARSHHPGDKYPAGDAAGGAGSGSGSGRPDRTAAAAALLANLLEAGAVAHVGLEAREHPGSNPRKAFFFFGGPRWTSLHSYELMNWASLVAEALLSFPWPQKGTASK